ncbi:MAG: NTP transferase domain-containing protein [Candidatus Aenigmarchaeota archaeon]|nr:NTP transferase domain-containing protein [Candidatus Aenigmarchaeota archaeon]
MKIQAVILAAGAGTRMQPLTGDVSKVMLPAANIPMLEHIVKMMETITDEIIIVINKGQKDVKNYFDHTQIQFAIQKHQLGTADALRAAEKYLSNNFIVKNGDELILKRDLEKFAMTKPYTIACFRVKEPQRFGVFSLSNGFITDIIEKPKEPPSNLINAGMYLSDLDIFDAIRKTPVSERGEYEITDSWKILIEEGKKIKPFILEKWNTIGYPWHFFDANKLILDDSGSTIKSHISADIEEPVAIGRNVIIGNNTKITKYSSIGNSCEIGENVLIKNSVIMEGCQIADNAKIMDSVIGKNVIIGENSILDNTVDGKTVKMWVNGKLVDSRRKELGSVIGHNTIIGDNIKIKAGTKIDPDSKITKRVV